MMILMMLMIMIMIMRSSNITMILRNLSEGGATDQARKSLLNITVASREEAPGIEIPRRGVSWQIRVIIFSIAIPNRTETRKAPLEKVQKLNAKFATRCLLMIDEKLRLVALSRDQNLWTKRIVALS